MVNSPYRNLPRKLPFTRRKGMVQLGELNISDDHPLASEISSLRLAVARFQAGAPPNFTDESYSSSLKLQRHSLDAANTHERALQLERENDVLRSEVAVLRANPRPHDASEQAQQVQQLTLSLRRLSDKLNLAEGALLARTTELAHATAEAAKARLAAEGAYELAARTRGREEAGKVREVELEWRVRAAEEAVKMSDLVVNEYADLVRSLEARAGKRPGVHSRSSSFSSSSVLDSANEASEKSVNATTDAGPTTLAQGLSQGKLGLQRLVAEFSTATEKLQAELVQLHGELALSEAKCDTERKAAEQQRIELANVRFQLKKLELDDNAAAKMVSRYMKFSQKSTDALQNALTALQTRHGATIRTLSSQLHERTAQLRSSEAKVDQLRSALDELGADAMKEVYGRRREVALRIRMVNREERIQEELERWVLRAEEALERGLKSEYAIQSKMTRDARQLLSSLLDGGGSASPGSASSGSLARMIVARSAVEELSKELEVETARRLEVERILARNGSVPTLPEGSDALQEVITPARSIESPVVLVSEPFQPVHPSKEPTKLTPSSPATVDSLPALNKGDLEHSSLVNLEEELGGEISDQRDETVPYIQESREVLPSPQLLHVQDEVSVSDTPVVQTVVGTLPLGDPGNQPLNSLNLDGNSVETTVEVSESPPRGSNHVKLPPPPYQPEPVGSDSPASLLHTEDKVIEPDSRLSDPSPLGNIDDRPPGTPPLDGINSDGNTLEIIVETSESHPKDSNDATLSSPSCQSVLAGPSTPISLLHVKDQVAESDGPLINLDNHPPNTPPLNGVDLNNHSIEITIGTPPEDSNDLTSYRPESTGSSVPTTSLPVFLDASPANHAISESHSENSNDITPPPVSDGSGPSDLLPTSPNVSTDHLDPPEGHRHPLLADLIQVSHRYDDLQRAFRNCHLALEALKNTIPPAPSDSTFSTPGLHQSSAIPPGVLRTALERLNDYTEDARVELEIRIADEALMARGFEILLSVPGALSSPSSSSLLLSQEPKDDHETAPNQSEVERQVEAFISGSDPAVEKSFQSLTRKLDDIEHDIAALKRTAHDSVLLSPSMPLTAPVTNDSGSWASWIRGSPSQPSSPASGLGLGSGPTPTFGNIMTTPRLRHSPSLNFGTQSGKSYAGGKDPIAALGLRVPMPSYVHVPQAPQRSRTVSTMYMLGLGARKPGDPFASPARHSRLPTGLSLESSAGLGENDSESAGGNDDSDVE